MASSDIPVQLAETIQTAHINREPSARHDINPSTAADTREPVKLESKGAPDDELDDEDDGIPASALRPARRFSHLPPIPDLRFEQSYLHSIQNAQSWWMIAWITVRDQVRSIPLALCTRRSTKEVTTYMLMFVIDGDADAAGSCLQSCLGWLAALEQECTDKRELVGCKSPEVVVRSQQLADPPKDGEGEGRIPMMKVEGFPERVSYTGVHVGAQSVVPDDIQSSPRATGCPVESYDTSCNYRLPCARLPDSYDTSTPSAVCRSCGPTTTIAQRPVTAQERGQLSKGAPVVSIRTMSWLLCPDVLIRISTVVVSLEQSQLTTSYSVCPHCATPCVV